MSIFNSGLMGEGLPDVVAFETDEARMAAQIEAELGALSLDSVISA